MKKILSIILAVTMLLTSLVFSTTALADEEEPVVISYSVCDYGMLTLEPTEIEVTADLSDKYAELVGYNDTLEVPTVLDATIAAHIFMFGEDFMEYAPLKIDASGYPISSAFGEETSSLTYRNNGISCWSMDEALTDGGYVEFMFYQDTIGYSDSYVYFNARKIVAGVGKKTVITATKECYDSEWNIVELPASNIMVTLNGYDIGTTDENGQISFVFDEEGDYKLSAYTLEEGAPIFIPYASVTTRKYQLEDYVKAEIDSGIKFITSKDDLYDVSNSVYFLNLLKSSNATNMQKLYFVDSVKSNLIANDGKIVIYDAESVGTYGAVIQALELCGYNAEYFYGYNLYDALEQMDVNGDCHPYYYRYAIEVASEKYAIELCRAYIEKYYSIGNGLNYYGYSCDNTGNFLASIAKYKDVFIEYVNDAVNVLDSYSTDLGYFYSHQYTDENANSTASALLGYALIGESEKAYQCYSMLVENYEGKTGEFLYYDEPNAYATKDAVVALEAYYDFVYNNNYEHPVHLEKLKSTVNPSCTEKGSKTYVCPICNKKKVETIKATGHKEVIDKAVAATYEKAGKTQGSHCKTCGKVLTAQKTVAKLTVSKPTSVKATAKSKAFKLSWSKNSKATGYEIQYSTKKDFSSKKTVKVTSNSTVSKTVSKLTAKKKYYVRIRAYKTYNKKNYYSSWVTTSVTTKK